MSDRERQSYAAFMESEREAERRAEEARMAPIRAAEAELQATHAKLRSVYAERLLARVKDPDVFIDPSVASVRMSHADADAFNYNNWKSYFTPRRHLYSDALGEMLKAYWLLNRISIQTESMFANVTDRIIEAGLLPEPAPMPEPEPATEPEIKVRPQGPPEPPAMPIHIGRDPLTGLDREYTDWEVNRMSAREFARAFSDQICRTTADFARASREQRENRR